MSTNEELCRALAEDKLFQMLPKGSQVALLSRMALREYNKGQNVYGFDDSPVGLYFLFYGGLIVEWPGHFDVNAAHYYTPGSWFGQLSSMTETNRLVTVISASEAKIGFLPQVELKLLMDSDTEIIRHLGRITQARLKTALDAIADLMIRKSEPRFLATLIRLTGINNPLYKGDIYEVYLSQEEVARIANISRTVANSILKRLEEDNIIQSDYRRINILNADALRSFFSNSVQ